MATDTPVAAAPFQIPEGGKMNDSQQAGADVARALGFDPKEFLEINLRFRAGDLLVVDAQQLVIGDRLKKVADEIVNRKFVCREIKDDGAPVAVRAEPRHDAATCCGERQEPDVGEGWRLLGPDDVQQEGDEWCLTGKTWKPIPPGLCGKPAWCGEARYRRRVTPAKPVEIDGDKPDVGEGWRWVEPGEILRDEDEFLPYWSRDDENPWREIHCTGMSVGANEPRTYRRRVTLAKPVEIDGNKPDVGEGWRELGDDEILRPGDEADIGVNCPQWVPTQHVGQRAGIMEDRYRRRMTPVPEAQPDFGEGWRWLDPDEILQEGDEYYGVNCGFVPTGDWGYPANHVGGAGPYRRRMTPEAQPIEITPAAVSAMCERNARDALLRQIESLKAENHEQKGKIMQACLENERLRSEVERLRPEAPQSRLAATWAAAHRVVVEALAAEQEEVKKLRSEVERLKKGEAALRAGLANLRTGLAEAKNTNLVDYIDAILKRQGGGE